MVGDVGRRGTVNYDLEKTGKNVEIRAHWSPMSGQIELLVSQNWQQLDPNIPYGVVTNVGLTQVDHGQSLPVNAYPTFTLRDGDAQTLMDQLWKCGVRPSEGKGSAGQIAAVEKHLADMQKLAFGYFEREKERS